MFKKLITIVLLLNAVGLQAQKQLPGLTYSKEPATLVVQIKHFSELPDCKNFRIGYVQGLLRERKVDTIALSADGKGMAFLDLTYTKVVSFGGLGENEVSFLMTPGKKTVLTVDAKLLKNPDPKKPTYTFKGENAEYNKDRANYASEYQERKLDDRIFEGDLKVFKGKDVQQYKEKVMSVYNEGIAKLNADKRLGSAFKDFEKTCYQIHIGSNLSSASDIISIANGGKAADYPTPPDFMDEFKAWNPFASDNVLYTIFSPQLETFAKAYAKEAGMEDFTVPESYSQISNAINYIKAISNLHPLSPEQLQKLSSDCPIFEQEVISKNEALKAKLEKIKSNP